MSYQAQTNLSEHRLKPAGQRYFYSKTDWFFSLQDLDRLKGIVTPTEEGTVKTQAGPAHVDQSLRASKVSFIEPSEDSKWLYEKIGEAIRFHNQTYYNFDLTGIEHLQFTEYPENAGYYGPHLDWGSGLVMGRSDICRKLSFTIQLSNPDSYEGGDFRICNGESFDAEIPKIRPFGTLIVFPSWIQHEVTPVTKGTRRSLVGWCLGPDFR